MTARWRDWQLPNKTPVFDSATYNYGVSRMEADVHVFGLVNAFDDSEVTVTPHDFYVVEHAEHGVLLILRDMQGRALETIPCPDTFEEAVAWMRLAAAALGGG